MIACALPAQDLGVAPPGVHWRKLLTPHFTVLYGAGQDSAARRVANTAEAVHARLVPFLKWRPDGPTTVIVTDNSDEANAMASPLPHRTIALNLSQPLGDFGNYQDWLYEVLVHEYTHVLQTDMVDGFPAGLQSVFGRLYVPNFIQPVHQIEGLAVYTETAFTGFGRDRSAYYDGVLRSFVRAGRWLPLDRAAVFLPQWPTEAPYLFGGKFIEYLAARFGADRVARYQRQHSRLAWPFLQNWVAKSVFGASFDALWRDWRGRSDLRYRGQIDSIAAAGLRPATPLTSGGYGKTGLAASRDGRLLAWFEHNADEFPALKMLDRKTGKTSTLDQGYCAGSLSFSPDGSRIAYAKLDYRKYWQLQYDLYDIDIASRKVQRLTRGARAHDPVWSPDGRSLLFVTDSLGMNALARIDLATRNVAYLTPFDGSRYGHPSYSPDGSRVALSVWCPGGYQDIYLLDPAVVEFRPLLVDRAQDLSPAWSADGRSVLFASDRSGVWNIYSYDLDSARLDQVSNAIGGAVSPAALAGRDTICYLELSDRGFDVVAQAVDPAGLRPAPAFNDTGRMEIPEIPDSSYPDSDYRPWRSLKPYFWFLSGFADQQGGTVGAFCLGSDALTQLNYQLSLGAARDHGRTPYSITLTDTRWPLPLSLSLSDLAVSHDVRVGGIDTAYWERQQTQQLEVRYAWRTSVHSLSPALAYRHRRLSGLNDLLPGGNPFWTGHLASLRLSCTYNDAHSFGRSISPERGRMVHIEAEAFGKALGSQIDQHIAWARWTEYLPLPFSHHVLVLDARSGIWQASGRSHFDDSPAFDLRGYDSGMLYRKYRAAATAEYRCPLLRIERGISTWPFFWKGLDAAAFMETGAQGGTAGDLTRQRALRSFGAELRGDWLFSYAIPVRMTLGYARTVVRPLQQAVYWSIAIEL